MTAILGIDFGGTSLRAAVVDPLTGQVGRLFRAATPAREGPQAVINVITDLALQALATCAPDVAPRAAGIGCPAFVDLERGRLLNVPNVAGDWPEVPLAEILAEKIGMPVFPINDVRAITLGEFTFGAGRGANNLACYAVGTGIGGGVILNGQLHLGISGSAGELGHQVIDRDGTMCNCGNRGCLETLASGPAISAQAAQAVIQRRPTLIASLVEQDLNRIDPGVVAQAAHMGDAVAGAIWEWAGEAIGIAVVNTLVTLSPDRVLIGGGVAEAAGDLLLDPIRRTVCERSFMTPVERVEILPTELGDQAGLLGTALWAHQQAASKNQD
ncbi:MAG TPA: ROK family protein [Anaerolinea sp.]|nr:ROK family protein [Anaerolinea sp.]